MAKINLLPPDLIGKIAAGEVVERPAAAIKELVENSLDAGAKSITVEIQEGGISSFRVTDDGCGIDESDLRMAFERHATSKIHSLNDLSAIGTLGFRGEALASIAAVSKVTLTTRPRDRETGLRVQNEGGRILSITEVACAPGTGILVKDLFYNVPVRLGFLKKPGTEANAVTDLLVRLILSRPDVSFRYLSGGKLIYRSPGDGREESAALTIHGVQAVKTMRRVEGCEQGVVIRGFVGIGENARSNRSGQSFFVNGRMLRSPLLSGALEDACRERVMIGKYPICVLYLTMPFESVNVNVHPNKMEVRFRDDQAVRSAVFSLVWDALQDRDAFQRPVEMPLTEGEDRDGGIPDRPRAAAGTAVGADAAPRIQVQKEAWIPDDAAPRMMEKPAPVYAPVGPRPGPAPGPAPEEPLILPAPETRLSPARQEEFMLPDVGEAAQAEATDTEAESFRYADIAPEGERKVSPYAEKAPGGEEQLSALPADTPVPMKIFGALFDTFILIEYADHLLMVDQHAVHERLLYEKMMKAYSDQSAGQEMLVPYVVSLTHQEMNILEENRELLEGLGLTVEPFGEYEAAIRRVPVTLGENETAAFLREAIDALENGRIPGAEKKRAAILQMACKHAVKGGEPLPEALLRSLVEEMIDKKVTPTCPHGRPLVVSISHTELDRKFKRIQ
ncbi:MAG: DNA mismatch repair endonuclease MutL [Clostridia bacterium]|nr:DNA mismatch repair endonuclease MutL [Clostridia bacterium]